MPLFAFEGTRPRVSPTAWLAPGVDVIGDVTIEEGASIWFGVVLRADFAPIVIRAGVNVQDGSVIHGGPDVTEIGQGATIGHGCVVHNAYIGEEALVGNGAVVLDGARIGSRALVAAGSTVSPGTVVPDGELAIGSPARVRGPLSASARLWVERNPEVYRTLARRYREGLTLLED
jgi:carbonic anhydrase/acetyltransferase-like protein (isoleucine patch superfamily)